MHMKTSAYLYTFILAISLFACSQNSQEGIVEIDASKLQELRKEGVAIIDVRSAEEVAQGKIPGAKHIQLSDDFATKVMRKFGDKPVVVYCQSGGRSTRAATQLKLAGMTKIYNYKGSFGDWKSKGLKIEKN